MTEKPKVVDYDNLMKQFGGDAEAPSTVDARTAERRAQASSA